MLPITSPKIAQICFNQDNDCLCHSSHKLFYITLPAVTVTNTFPLSFHARYGRHLRCPTWTVNFINNHPINTKSPECSTSSGWRCRIVSRKTTRRCWWTLRTWTTIHLYSRDHHIAHKSPRRTTGACRSGWCGWVLFTSHYYIAILRKFDAWQKGHPYPPQYNIVAMETTLFIGIMVSFYRVKIWTPSRIRSEYEIIIWNVCIKNGKIHFNCLFLLFFN